MDGNYNKKRGFLLSRACLLTAILYTNTNPTELKGTNFCRVMEKDHFVLTISL